MSRSIFLGLQLAQTEFWLCELFAVMGDKLFEGVGGCGSVFAEADTGGFSSKTI